MLKNNNKVLGRFLQIFAILLVSIFYLNNFANAHWIQTHQRMIVLAKESLKTSPPFDRIHQFLDSTIVDKGIIKTYLRLIQEGARDADLRANGLFGISKVFYNSCYDLTLNITCPGIPSQSTYNISGWPVGDHGYNPTSGTGFNSLIVDKSAYVNDLEAKNPTTFQLLLSEISRLYPDCVLPCTPRLKLIELLQISNAADMAAEFYRRAQTAFREKRYVDSMYNLGIAVHLVQDLTVPHHSKLISDSPPNIPHYNYEEHVWKVTLAEGENFYSVIGNYTNYDARTWVKNNANLSINFSLDPNISATDCVQLGVKSTIGLLYSFFKSVNYLGSDFSWINNLLLLDEKTNYSYTEGWDGGTVSGWMQNTTRTTVSISNSGGNPKGYLLSVGNYSIGAVNNSDMFTGNFLQKKIYKISVDVLFLTQSCETAMVRFRYKGPQYNGWSFYLPALRIQNQWQSFSVPLNPAWSDEEAISAGWRSDGPLGSTVVSFKTTMSDAYNAEVRIEGFSFINGQRIDYKEAGIDNFGIYEK